MSQSRSPPPSLSKGKEAELVVEKLRSDKTLDALNREALRCLKDDPKLNKAVRDLITNSNALRKKGSHLTGAQLQTRLKDELEDVVTKEATVRLWELLSSRDQGVGVALDVQIQSALMDVLAEHTHTDTKQQ